MYELLVLTFHQTFEFECATGLLAHRRIVLKESNGSDS